ncbi:hypothetical protein I3271_22330 [Photobacterium leiognathi]|uniref:hypothetical protein n=1 Tax=Photobacterium leiognathi TaxID=553611 RepID=UPI000D16CC3F|nr:hypothetical protein [Photobacterium leiognathi]MCG3887421.1 hypothetical protein [Photobacterium leiognathi]PSW66189.1 hypothetical protein C0W88_07345 [Photobacterium leiognathi subsp. mandapamensis]
MNLFRKWHDNKLIEESENISKGRIWGMIVTCLFLFFISFGIFPEERLVMFICLMIGSILGANVEKLVALYTASIKQKRGLG